MNKISSLDSTVTPSSPIGFADLGLAQPLHEAIKAAGYREPTPIQKEAIPRILAGQDVLGCAQTGTGKTAAFALPILHGLLSQKNCEKRPPIRTLVLAPTRELAVQIGDSFRKYGTRSQLRQHVVYGGVSKVPQIRALRRGVDVLVATPGRLLYLMNGGEICFKQVQYFVLDEADRMLDMGFIHDVRRITKALPKKRQTMLFGATLPPEIRELASHILTDPVRVAVDPVASTCEPIAQSVYFVEARKKGDLLLSLLEEGDIDRALVFTRTKHGANRLAQKLVLARVPTAAIHSNKSQAARERALDGFKRGRTRVVVATDVAARGIDVKGLSHVVNFDLPNDPESYVHRVGRTGRAGATGVAISFCAAGERPYLSAIERLTCRVLGRLKAPASMAWDGESSPQQAKTSPARAERTRHSREGQRNSRHPGDRKEGRSGPRHHERWVNDGTHRPRSLEQRQNDKELRDDSDRPARFRSLGVNINGRIEAEDRSRREGSGKSGGTPGSVPRKNRGRRGKRGAPGRARKAV